MRRLKLKRLSKLFTGILGIILIAGISGEAELSHTSPSSPVTTLRIEAFTDSFKNIYNSSWTVVEGTWSVVNDSYTWVVPGQVVQKWGVDMSTTPWGVVYTSCTLQEFMNQVSWQARENAIREVVEKDVQLFMVYPGTNCITGWLYRRKADGNWQSCP